jgi:hypothetical protein
MSAPKRIWATVNGASTRLPDGGRQLIGGWSEDKDIPRAVEYIRADLSALEAPAAASEVTEDQVERACLSFIPHWYDCTPEVKTEVFQDMRAALTAALKGDRP